MWQCIISTVKVRVVMCGIGQDNCTGDVGVSQGEVRLVGVGVRGRRRRKELRALG